MYIVLCKNANRHETGKKRKAYHLHWMQSQYRIITRFYWISLKARVNRATSVINGSSLVCGKCRISYICKLCLVGRVLLKMLKNGANTSSIFGVAIVNNPCGFCNSNTYYFSNTPHTRHCVIRCKHYMHILNSLMI